MVQEQQVVPASLLPSQQIVKGLQRKTQLTISFIYILQIWTMK